MFWRESICIFNLFILSLRFQFKVWRNILASVTIHILILLCVQTPGRGVSCCTCLWLALASNAGLWLVKTVLTNPGTGNGTNMIYLMSENCCRDTWRSRDRISNVANCGEFARQGHSYDRLMQGVPGLMIISSWLTCDTDMEQSVQFKMIKVRTGPLRANSRAKSECGDKLKLFETFLSSGKNNNWIYQWNLKRLTWVMKECH